MRIESISAYMSIPTGCHESVAVIERETVEQSEIFFIPPYYIAELKIVD
jgi:hypothetical protein